MTGKIVFKTTRAPLPKGPYSQAVSHNGVLYVSGQIPVDPASGEVRRGSIREEAELVLTNLSAIIEDAGATLGDVLRLTCYLTNIDDFAEFNSVYEEFFSTSPPARTTVQVARLPLGVRIEIDAIVALP